MLEKYKNAVLTTSVAATDRDTLKKGLKSATIIFGKVMKQLLCKSTQNGSDDKQPINSDDSRIRCIWAYVSRIKT